MPKRLALILSTLCACGLAARAGKTSNADADAPDLSQAWGLSRQMLAEAAPQNRASPAAAPRQEAPTVLLILAHPDDETMIGGTLGRLKELGAKVYAAYLTRGESGVNLDWVDQIRALAKERSIPIDPAQIRYLPPDNPLVRMDPPPDLVKVRAAELAEAARRFGIEDYLQLHERDGLADPNRGVAAPTWNLDRVGAAISRFARRVRPDIILTTLPDDPAIHPQHQAAGRLARDLFNKKALGPKARELYGFEERDWYGPEAFPAVPGRIFFQRKQPAPQLGGTYADFQWQGASVYHSQPPGRKGESPSIEAFAPLERREPVAAPAFSDILTRTSVKN